MKPGSIADVTVTALQEMFGPECWVPKPQKAPKLKNGHDCWRISGTSPSSSGWFSKAKDGRIYLYYGWSDRKNAQKQPFPVDRQRLYEEHDDWPHHYKWEWHVVDLGSDRVAAHLQQRLRAAGHHVEVRVGNPQNGYPTSIAIERLSERHSRNAAFGLLLERLPVEGAPFPAADRTRWLEQARLLLDLVYGSAD